jgi:hypothetical protein
MAFRRCMSAIRSQAEVQALLGEGPGCAKSGHSLSLQRTTAPSPFKTLIISAAFDTKGGELMGWMAPAPTDVAMRHTAGVINCK